MENIYMEGTIITAKVAPMDELVIVRYYQRIYYCKLVSDPGQKLLAYFERELINPLKQILS